MEHATRALMIARKLFGICVVTIGVLPAVQLAAAGARAIPRSASVCELATNPQRFDGSLVRVRGKIDGNGRNKIFIEDDACPEYGVALDGAGVASNDPNMRRMTEAEGDFSWQKKSEQKTIRATIIGTYHYNEIDIPTRLLIMESVHNLTIR